MTCYLAGSTYQDFIKENKELDEAKRHYDWAIKNGYQLDENPTDNEILKYWRKSQ